MTPGMTDRERYLFDVQGYVVIPGFLDDEEVARLNEAVDANAHLREECGEGTAGSATLAGARRQQYTGMLSWDQPWCEPFRDLIAPASAVGYLDDLLGRGWHMDTEPVYFHYPKGAGGLKLHQGEHYFDPGAYYVYQNGRMHNGLVVCQYTLSDQHEGDGGFGVIPGSHKANFPRPGSITTWESDREAVRNPTVRAGDLLIFTEAVTHGTLPWTAQHDRRALHYRYSSKVVQYGGGFHTFDLPHWADELTEAQRAVLEPAYFYKRPLLSADGSVARPLMYNDAWDVEPAELEDATKGATNASVKFLESQQVQRQPVDDRSG